jgi:hypothetical protein
MIPPAPLRRALRAFGGVFLPGLLIALRVHAATPESDVLSTTRMREEILRMTDFFDNDLPGTLRRYNLTLDFSPKFSDLRNREFMRYPFGLRYGATDRWELFGGLTPFTPNPFNSGHEHRWGFGEGSFGARYDIPHYTVFFDEITFGVENRVPLGDPPLDINEGYTHIRPFMSAARKLMIVRHTTFYTNISYDHEVSTPTRENPVGVTRRHVAVFAPSFLYKPNEFGTFVQYSFRHFDEPGNNHLGHEYQLGVIWDVPLVRTQKWKLPGKWQIELGFKTTVEEGYPTDRGLSLRVRWRTNLRQVLHWDTGQPQKSPDHP